MHDFLYPICGCDACHSSWQTEAAQLEKQVFAAVNGNYRESIASGRRPATRYVFTYPDGASSGDLHPGQLPSERLAAAQKMLGDLPDGWSAWPLRP